MKQKLIDVCKFKENIFTISSDAKIKDAVFLLNKNNIGCLVVIDDGNIVGIVSERDILRELGNTSIKNEIHNVKISKIMTPREQLVLGHTGDTIEDLMGYMDEKNIRHIPLVDEEGKLVCLTSSRDIIKILLKVSHSKIKYLSDYVEGKYPG
jgi:CBS domain-containing protein